MSESRRNAGTAQSKTPRKKTRAKKATEKGQEDSAVMDTEPVEMANAAPEGERDEQPSGSTEGEFVSENTVAVEMAGESDAPLDSQAQSTANSLPDSAPASSDHPEPQNSNRPQSHRPLPSTGGKQVSAKPVDEYSIQLHYDRNLRQFIASVLEFPEIRATGISREAVLIEIEDKLEPHIIQLSRRGETLPEAVFSRSYPESLEVFPSQNLYRRLDLMSRQEKVPMDQLIVELLSTAVERRYEQPGKGGRDNHRSSHHSSSPQQGGGHQNRRGPRHQQTQQSHGRRQSGHQARGYHETMDSRENFMEYVRNLEKGGWRKK